MSKVEAVGFPPFNDHSTVVDISEQDREVGKRAYHLFVNELIRPQAWDIKGDRIVVNKSGLVLTNGLENERISDRLARTIEQFKRVEDFLPDYMGRSFGVYRNNMGIAMAYNQWGKEEVQHSLAEALILVKTGHKTPDQIVEDYQRNQRKTWEPPFDTERQMTLYTVFQELNTCLAYLALADAADLEDAHVVAGILRIIGNDEGYHYRGGRSFSRIYYEVDPEGTTQDALYVATNYRAPALNLHPDPRQALKDAMATGAYSRRMIQDQVIYPGLVSLKFIPKDLARVTANEYRIKGKL